MTVYKDQDVCLIFNIGGQSKIGFCTHMSVIHKERSPIITLVTNEVDEVYNKLIKLGVEVKEKPKKNQKFNNFHFFFNDPNGYTIKIQNFLD